MGVVITILKVIFFTSLLGIVHSYVFYPLFMRFLGLFDISGRRAKNHSDQPAVEIIFAAFNEEGVIQEKIRSCLKSNYPVDKLTVRIGSDASSDDTDSMVRDLQKSYPQIHFHRFDRRTGKSEIINQLVKHSEADLLIMTDANIIFDESTVPNLVNSMENPKVGITGGKIIYQNINRKGISIQEDIYLRWENELKRLESDIFGKAMGVEGGCYIIRRELFPGIPRSFFMEDFYISLAVMQAGYNVLINENAHCYEDVSVQSSEEYKRKVRISIGNFQNLKRYRKLLIRNFFPTGFIFLSHKVLRWFTPFFLIILLMTGMFLAPTSIYFALFSGLYMCLIGLGLFGILFSQKKYAGILKYPGHFIHMNLALLEGFFVFTKGVESNVWQPTRRNQN